MDAAEAGASGRCARLADAGLCFAGGETFRDAAGGPRTGLKKVVKANHFRTLLYGNFIANSSVVVRRSVLEDVGPFNTDAFLHGAEDYEMWLRIAHRYPLVGLDECLITYRIHGKNLGRYTGLELHAVESISCATWPELQPFMNACDCPCCGSAANTRFMRRCSVDWGQHSGHPRPILGCGSGDVRRDLIPLPGSRVPNVGTVPADHLRAALPSRHQSAALLSRAVLAPRAASWGPPCTVHARVGDDAHLGNLSQSDLVREMLLLTFVVTLMFNTRGAGTLQIIRALIGVHVIAIVVSLFVVGMFYSGYMDWLEWDVERLGLPATNPVLLRSLWGDAGMTSILDGFNPA